MRKLEGWEGKGWKDDGKGEGVGEKGGIGEEVGGDTVEEEGMWEKIGGREEMGGEAMKADWKKKR